MYSVNVSPYIPPTAKRHFCIWICTRGQILLCKFHTDSLVRRIAGGAFSKQLHSAAHQPPPTYPTHPTFLTPKPTNMSSNLRSCLIRHFVANFGPNCGFVAATSWFDRWLLAVIGAHCLILSHHCSRAVLLLMEVSAAKTASLRPSI